MDILNSIKNWNSPKNLRKMRNFLLIALAVVLILVAVLSGIAYWDMRPTTGKKIPAYAEPKTAIMIIDIQEDFTGPEAKKPYKDGDQIVQTSNILLKHAVNRGYVVIFIKNIIDNSVVSAFSGHINVPGSPGTEMDRRLIRMPGAKTFTKNRSDAFSNMELDRYLRENKVDNLLITGLDAAYCVNSTIMGALNRGYKVTVFSKGVATESRNRIEDLAAKWEKAGAIIKTGEMQ